MLTIHHCRKIVESFRAVEHMLGPRGDWARTEVARYEQLIAACKLAGMGDFENIDILEIEGAVAREK